MARGSAPIAACERTLTHSIFTVGVREYGMDEAEGTERQTSKGWLLATVRATNRTVARAEDSETLIQTLPETLTEPDHNRFAWVGQPFPTDRTIRVRASSDPLPEVIEVPEGELPTKHAIEQDDCQIATEPGTNPEYRRLHDQYDGPAVGATVSIPIGEESVLHLYTDGDVSAPETRAVFTELGETITVGLKRCTLATELEHERDRLDELRSVVSHDLGNPLNVAAGRLDLARIDCDSEHLENVEGALKQIDSLADDALTFVKVGKEVTDRAELSLTEIARDCWEHTAQDRGELTIEETTVKAEPERFRMILNELFRNAFAHNDGEITATVGPLETQRGFYVEDDGEGIPTDEREYVFDRGYTTTKDRDGNGLAIIEEIVAAHDWEVGLTVPDGTRIEIQTERW